MIEIIQNETIGDSLSAVNINYLTLENCITSIKNDIDLYWNPMLDYYKTFGYSLRYYEYNDKQHVHFVDIFIKSQNRCIEIKSTWTFEKHNVLLKQKAAKELGYPYRDEIWVYDRKGNKTCYN